MYTGTLEKFANLAQNRAEMLRHSFGSFFVGSLMAGAYVGFGIILIFTLAVTLPPEYRTLIMGASFGIALVLVIIAGSELFTGLVMFMAIGRIRNKVSTADVGKVWGVSWLGNLMGALGLCYLYYLSGGVLVSQDVDTSFLLQVASNKMNASASELVAKGILCNWLVCLAIWMAARLESESAKMIAIFWCLFAFIASGYEHSVANMTVFGLSLLAEHPNTVSWSGMGYNLFWVSLGNIISGVLFMGVGYSLADPKYIDKKK